MFGLLVIINFINYLCSCRVDHYLCHIQPRRFHCFLLSRWKMNYCCRGCVVVVVEVQVMLTLVGCESNLWMIKKIKDMVLEIYMTESIWNQTWIGTWVLQFPSNFFWINFNYLYVQCSTTFFPKKIVCSIYPYFNNTLKLVLKIKFFMKSTRKITIMYGMLLC
jgi:hypothetical protein